MNRKMIAVIIIVLVIVMGAVYVFATQNSNVPDLSINNTTDSRDVVNNASKTVHNQTKNQNATKQNNTAQVKISAAQAQQIAINAAKKLVGENCTAGTSKLFKWTANKKHTWAGMYHFLMPKPKKVWVQYMWMQ